MTLEIRIDDAWVTVRLWDNSDAVDEHHEHEYTRREGKQPPATVGAASVNEAMAGAIRKAKREWRAIVQAWSEER